MLLMGRGAQTAGFATQFYLEQAILNHHRASGLTLDLVKCFNNIAWDAGFRLLETIGVPSSILRQYVTSLKRICRYWSIQGSLLFAGPHSRGFPEGDVWSVLVMICLAACWVYAVTSRTQHLEAITLSAYADNWSWVVRSIQAHQFALEATCQLLEWTTLRIDWSKTWFWCTSNQDARNVAAMIAPFSGGVEVARKDSALDLGFQLHYNLKPARGVSLTRVSEGLAKLQRVKGLPHCLSVKEQMIRSSVLPSMLHGCEIKPVSADELQHVRSEMATALYGHCSLSPCVALLLTRGEILDPEYWMIWRVICAARKFVLAQSPDNQRAFMATAAQFRGTLNKVVGPATAFGFCLQKLGWGFNRHGGIHVTPFITINFLQSSRKRLSRFAVLAWQDYLLQVFTTRREWRGLPDISRHDTLAVLMKFSDSDRKLLTRSIAGGYQLQTQKSKWVDDSDPFCEHCGVLDSNSHRLLECTLGHTVRNEHLDIVEHIQEHAPTLPDLPVVHVHENSSALQLIQFNFPPTIVNDGILAICDNMIQAGIQPHWYTDGSTMHPSIVGGRFAAYSVVLDLCLSDSERRDIADAYRFSSDFPPSLVPAFCNRCTGEQDILRAEMHAIFDIFQEIGQGVIHSDSQAALRAFGLMLQADSVTAFAACDHFDLLSRLFDDRLNFHCRLEKVKAHRDISLIEDPLERYKAIGNRMANDLAVSTVRTFLPQVVMQFETMAQDIKFRRKRLYETFLLNVELQKFRAKAVPTTVGRKGAHFTTDVVVQALSQWEPSIPVPILDQYTTRFLQFSVWGGKFTLMLLQWLEQLRWPYDEESPLDRKIGISWAELGLSWMLYFQQVLPIVRRTNNGTSRVVQPGSSLLASQWGMTLAEAGQSCKALMDHAMGLIPEFVLPTFQRGKVASLYIQGGGRFVSGWTCRPKIPRQACVAKHVQKLLAIGGADRFLQQFPVFSTITTADCVLEHSWEDGNRIASNAMKRVKAERA